MRRSKEDSELTRAAILDAAERTFCDKGYAATTLDAISREAGVTRGAFYWHFKDKADVLAALHERSFLPQEQILSAAAEADAEDPLGCLLDATLAALRSFEVDESRQRIFRIISHMTPAERGEALSRLDTEMRALVDRVMQRAQQNGSLHPCFTPHEAQVLVTVTVIGLLGEWLRSEKSFPLSDFGDRLMRRQLDLLRAEPRAERRDTPPGRAGPSVTD